MRQMVALFALLASACTTSLQVSKVDSAIDASRVGIPYNLPFTQYEIAITREVIKCDTRLTAKVGAEVTSVDARRDPKMRFVLDPASLASPLKTSEVKLEYDVNGIATSLNATAEDRTAQVIANVVGSVAKIASIAAMAGAPQVREGVCTQPVREALKAITTLRPGVKAATAIVESRTEALKALQTKVAALGINVDQRTKTRLSAAYDALSAATEELSDRSDALDKQLKVVTDKQTVRWPDHGNMFAGTIPLDDAVFNRWGSNLDDLPSSRDQFTLFLDLAPLAEGGRNIDVAARAEPALGVPFRSPEPGRLRVCGGMRCGPGVDILAERVSDVAQLGSVFYLPCKSRPFSSIGCSFTMASDGTLKSMGSAQEAAPAEGASGALLSSLDTAATLQGTLSTAGTKKREAATAALKAESDYAAATAALAPDPNQAMLLETAVVKANVELLQARKAEWDARVALEETRAKADSEQP